MNDEGKRFYGGTRGLARRVARRSILRYIWVMNSYLDILVFAVIAVFLLWRLRSSFGTRSDADPPTIGNPFQVKPVEVEQDKAAITLEPGAPPDMVQLAPANWTAAFPNYDVVENATVHHHLLPFAAIDPQFRPDEFLDKARKAYPLIVNAFAKGDKKTLQFLLSASLFDTFADAIDARNSGEVYQAQHHGLKRAIVHDAHLDGTQAFVTVDFTAEQTITHKRADGRQVGDNDGTKQINRDRWVFSKDLKSSDPKWILVKTEEIA